MRCSVQPSHLVFVFLIGTNNNCNIFFICWCSAGLWSLVYTKWLASSLQLMDWICMPLFKMLKAPHRVPGSIHSHTVILVVVNYDSSHSRPNGSVAAIQRQRPLRPPPLTYSSHTHSHSLEAKWVKFLAQGHNDHSTVGRDGDVPITSAPLL